MTIHTFKNNAQKALTVHLTYLLLFCSHQTLNRTYISANLDFLTFPNLTNHPINYAVSQSSPITKSFRPLNSETRSPFPLSPSPSPLILYARASSGRDTARGKCGKAATAPISYFDTPARVRTRPPHNIGCPLFSRSNVPKTACFSISRIYI